MKKYISAFIFLIFMTIPFFVHAGPEGPGHRHYTIITSEQAVEEAAMVLQKLVERGKLAQSWSNVGPSSAEKKSFKKGPEWVVSFSNPAETVVDRRTLYVFVSLKGKVLAANFSGE